MKNEIKAKKAKKKTKTSKEDWFENYYKNTVGASVINDYETGNVKTVYICIDQ